MFTQGFPQALWDDVHAVCQLITKRTYNNVRTGQSALHCDWLVDSNIISFPYRIYYLDDKSLPGKLTPRQKTIYHCLFSRSCDGFVREKHIKALLSQPLPLWATPYIIKVCEEYVVEILQTVAAGLQNTNTENFKVVCRSNLKTFLLGHDRMISYWNEYYRQRYPHYQDYIGNKLYTIHFGYTRSLERLRNT